jgi:hypothetical protein
VSRVNEAGRLRAVDYLGECAMEEGILDVELVHEPTPGDSWSQHNLNGGTLDDRAEGLIVVHLGALGDTPVDLVSLVPVHQALDRSNRTSALSLCLKIHLANDDIGPRRLRNQVSRAIGQ